MSPPPKEKRGCDTALKTPAIPKYAACRHSATVELVLPPSSVHHATKRCLHCGVFLKWLPKPKTLLRRRLTAFKLAQLGMCEGLSAWERVFIRDASQRKKLSPRQRGTLDQLCATYLGAKHHEGVV
jgi:hypothetical protein